MEYSTLTITAAELYNLLPLRPFLFDARKPENKQHPQQSPSSPTSSTTSTSVSSASSSGDGDDVNDDVERITTARDCPVQSQRKNTIPRPLFSSPIGEKGVKRSALIQDCVVVYAEASRDPFEVENTFLDATGDNRRVAVLEGGYEAFYQKFSFLCTTAAQATRKGNPHFFFYPSMIVDWFLFLGGIEALHPTVLENLKITHIVSVIDGPQEKLPTPSHTKEYTILKCPVADYSSENIRQHFDDAVSFLEKATNINNARVLVHCAAGCSRSPTIVIAYLMHHNRWTARQALVYVRERRAVAPNQGFLRQLLLYEERLGVSPKGPSLNQHGSSWIST